VNLIKTLILTGLVVILMSYQAASCKAEKVTFRKDGIMLINKKPFFPIGAFRNFSSSNGSELKKAGFNMTHEYLFEWTNASVEEMIKKAQEFLRDAHDNDLKVFMGISRRAIKKGNVKEIKKYVLALKNMPALVTWYLYDEPIMRKIPANILNKSANTIRSIDPDHPISLLLNHIRGPIIEKKKYTDIVDIVWVDPYPIGSKSKDPINVVGENISIAYKITDNKKPVWSVIQAFQWEYYFKIKTPQKDGAPTVPSKKQFRYMNYLALASGAKGLIYYWPPESYYNIIKDAPEVWATICGVVKELNTLKPFLTAYTDKKSPHVPRGFKLWTRVAEKRRVFAIINYHNKTQQFKWSLPWKNAVSLTSFPENKRVSLTEGEFDIKFSPLEVKVFMIKN
jgi:hypothetical protein